jgi:type II secretion system protein H
MRCRSARREGFTLMELMLVLAILAMLMAVAYPSLESMYDDFKLKAAADHLLARFAETRSLAIEQGQSYRVAIKPGDTGYKVAPNTSTYWSDATQADDQTGTPPVVIEDNLPGGITFGLDPGGAIGPSDSNGYAPIVTFFPDGSCDDDKNIRLTFQTARPLDIKLRSLTGSVTVRPGPLGGGP